MADKVIASFPTRLQISLQILREFGQIYQPLFSLEPSENNGFSAGTEVII